MRSRQWRPTVLAWVACLFVPGATSLRAQQSRPELIGSRVRVTVAADSLGPTQVLVGRLVAVGDSALVIRPLVTRPPGIEMEESVPTSRIQRFEVSTGEEPGKGARLGGLVGLEPWLLLGFALGEDCTSQELICFDRSATAAVAA